MRPNIKNIQNIAGHIRNEFNGDDLANVRIKITVDDGYLKKINEELFYRYSEGGHLTESDEVVLNVDGVSFYLTEKEKKEEDID